MDKGDCYDIASMGIVAITIVDYLRSLGLDVRESENWFQVIGKVRGTAIYIDEVLGGVLVLNAARTQGQYVELCVEGSVERVGALVCEAVNVA